ncbi:hypothetical protein VTH82DRAFT_8030 [Thermothelomyces myriococcoides]
MALGTTCGQIQSGSQNKRQLHHYLGKGFVQAVGIRYNVGVLASVLVHPGFKQTLGEPDAPRRGVITAVYYLGSWLSYVLFAHPVADRLGRRNAALGGMLVICLGQGLQTGAVGPHALAMVIAGRIIAGAGTAVISTSVPLYQSEISPPGQRGRYVVMNHVGFVAGLSSGFWVGYAMTFWNNDRGSAVGWRVSLGASFVPALIFVAALPFMRESSTCSFFARAHRPRWLVEHGKTEAALETLRFYREGSSSPDEVQAELSGIERSVAAFRNSGLTWVSLFSDGSLFARMWRAALLQFLAHLCGATAMKYYLPALFQALGFSHRVSLLAGGIESTLKTGCTVIDMLLIDRAGRRLTLIAGAGVMAFALLINGVLPLAYPDNASALPRGSTELR